jgi:hypothetical protein
MSFRVMKSVASRQQAVEDVTRQDMRTTPGFP